MNANYKICLEACFSCLEACNICFHACLNEEHPEKMTKCIELDRECADICGLTIAAMQRSSEFVRDICAICAAICEACGTECKKHDHQHCQRCAEACFRCADECRKLSA
ncbi:four-helix bundle copper-binding protein [Bacillus sp. FJAT-49736]|uniref:four-helix bundle copper-binding protein n=1 Tax=Bacillus sp. FJAT-49736 TaxID=2833582 RepID=UPI001BC8EA58|nr:four-helix bundle copper-binding protein [Bacillus sp. FJAT-49736]MBS4173172.1 four-helix bundle copper-binding protein [Bacillus sp. FJAT-49736]